MSTQISEQIVQEAIKDPETLYKSPEDVLNDERLSDEHKETILESWALDQRSLLVAEGESMEPSTGGNAAEKLQAIQDAQAKLTS